MKLKKIKDEIRAIGIDDAPFVPHTSGNVRVFGVVTRGNQRVEGIVQIKIEIDGANATDKIGEMIQQTNHYGQIRVVLLNGITFGGFNIVDIDKLSELVDRPVISVIEHEPNFESIKDALMKHYDDWEKRWAIFDVINIEKVKLNIDSKPLYVHYSGIDLTVDIVRNVLEKTTQISRIPECIRIAHMIGESYLKKK